METIDLWADLSRLRGRTLRTLGRGNAFDIVDFHQKGVVIRPHESMIERTITRKSFEDALNAIRLQGALDLKGVRAFNEMNPVYVAAMIAQLPYISGSSKPKITLRYAGEY